MKIRNIIVISIIAFAIAAGVVFKFLMPSLQAKSLQNGSDSGQIKATINVVGDNYLGYWFITSSQFKYLLHSNGYGLNWINDGGDYTDRNAKFKDGKYDIMVLPVNSYILHGLNNNYPGVIVAAISDSKGADSIIAYGNRMSSPPKVNDLNSSNLKFGFTPDSPSSFLLETAISHFDLTQLKTSSNWIVETPGGSKEAFEAFKNKKVDVAILWEPDVSRALTIPDAVQVFGSDQIDGMIIDVFVVNRKFLLDHMDEVLAFFNAYFETLVYYSTNQSLMMDEMIKSTNLDAKSVQSALGRISWFDKQTNGSSWFAQESQMIGNRARIIDTISQVTDVMIENGDFKEDPLHQNPFSIIASKDILSKIYAVGSLTNALIGVTPTNVTFSSLTDSEWNTLKMVGTLKVLPILFQSGTSQLTTDGKNTVDQTVEMLMQTYPKYRIVIKGHTAPSSDESANIILSQARSDSVKNYLVLSYAIDPNRIRSIGVGSKELLQRNPGEGDLSYRSRLSRVEFILYENK